MTKMREYQQYLLERLGNDRALSAEYLNAAFEEGEDSFLVAIKNVIDARGGGTEFANGAGISRDAIYKMFKENGNPRYKNLVKVLKHAGLSLRVAPFEDDAKTA